MRVYVYLFGDQVDEFFNAELEQMVEEKDGLGEAREMRSNLEETHIKIKKILKSKLAD